MMPVMAGGRVAYIVKRYPRLSETFILNEIRAMERLGVALHIYSLLPPEPPPHHPMVAEVKARPIHLPTTPGRKLLAALRSHAAAFRAAPRGYLRAAAHAATLMRHSRARLSTARQFLRAGFFADDMRRQGITHLHAHFANAPTVTAELASMMTGVPFSFTTHAKDLYLTSPRLIAERVGRAAFVVTCTHYNLDYLRTVVGSAAMPKLSLVYHGIDLSHFSYRPPLAPAAGRVVRLICVARLVAKKGLDDLVAACALLAAQGMAFHCEIVGGGPLASELAAQIAACGLIDKVSLRGAMTHADLIALYRTCDLFVLAPRIAEDGDRDGIPNVIVEAMATGLPVVSTSVSGIPELVRHEKTGLLVEPRDPAALAAAIARLITDPRLCRRLAEAARGELDQHFNCWETATALRDLVGARRCEAVTPEPEMLRKVA